MFIAYVHRGEYIFDDETHHHEELAGPYQINITFL